jgi:phage gpG-like protein
MESGTLEGSLRVLTTSANQVTVGSDRPYAAIHQLGGEHIPARPYLPFYQSGQITGLGKERVERALRASLRSRGL